MIEITIYDALEFFNTERLPEASRESFIVRVVIRSI